MTQNSIYKQGCLYIGSKLTILLNAMQLEKDGLIPEKDKKLLHTDLDRFVKAALSANTVYHGYEEKDNIEDLLSDNSIPFTSITDFTGTVSYHDSAYVMALQNKRVLLIMADREPELFRAAYRSLYALAQEHTSKLKGLLPEGYSLTPHVVDIEGTFET